MSWYTVCPGGGRWLLTLRQRPSHAPAQARPEHRPGNSPPALHSACGRGRGTVPAAVPRYRTRSVAPRETPPRRCDLSILPIAPQRSRRAPRRCTFICHYFTCARDDGPKQGWRRALAACRGVCAHHCPPRPVESRPRHPIHDRQPPIPQAHLSANFPSRPISARPLERIARPLGRRSGDEQPHGEASACSPALSRQREQGVRSTARSAARREPRRDRTLAETRHAIPVPRGVCVSMAPRPLRGRMTKEKHPRTAQPSHQAGARLRICNSLPRARPFPVERSAAKPTLARLE